MKPVHKEKFTDKKSPSFVGLDKILKCVIRYTHDESFGLTQQERFKSIMKLLFKTAPNEAGHPEAEFSPGMDKGNLYARIRETRLAETEDGKKITIKDAVRKNLSFVLYTGTEDSAVRYWSAMYSREAKFLEDPKIFEQRKACDKDMEERLRASFKKRQLALREISSCLRKYGWPL